MSLHYYCNIGHDDVRYSTENNPRHRKPPLESPPFADCRNFQPRDQRDGPEEPHPSSGGGLQGSGRVSHVVVFFCRCPKVIISMLSQLGLAFDLESPLHLTQVASKGCIPVGRWASKQLRLFFFAVCRDDQSAYKLIPAFQVILHDLRRIC